MLIQFASGDLREYLDAQENGPEDFAQWRENFGGRIYEDEDGQWWIYIGG